MKLMPASRAFATIREEVASSVGPPNIMVPRQIGEIFRPLRPSWRYCIFFPSHFPFSPCGRRWLASTDASRMRGLCPRIETPHPASSRYRSIAPPSPTRGEGTSLILQYLEHAVRHGDDAFIDGDFGTDENQAAGRAYHAGPGNQHL